MTRVVDAGARPLQGEAVAVGPLLTTKLHAPRRRRGLVARPRLIERLSRGNEAALTLVSAPAGFGKTTVLSDWLSAAPAADRCVAWLSLDARDDDPALFWAYLVAAVQTALPGAGAGALALLSTPQTSAEAVVTSLVNDLDAVPGDLVLVLDDYHLIESAEVHEGMAYLLEHLPPHAHLVIAGRADPPLPLARLRVRGELVELRAADLRFTPEEAAEYLTEAMGLALSAGEVAALDTRTEGWIAALQLAALSMQGRTDVTAFLTDFAGDDRYIVDYLVEEVLQRQPERVRSFLLQTSILSRLSGPLCDAVTGRHDGRQTLEALDRANLFLIPLDDRRRWYRYHHLFADVLQAHLLDEQPDAVAGLHRRAADWHETTGERAEAVHHALAGGDPARAAELIELLLPTLQQGRQEATVRRWLAALPTEVLRVRPVLSIGYAAALMVSGLTDGVEEHLRDAERWVTRTPGDGQDPRAPSAEVVVVDEEAFRRVPSAICLYRAGQALLSGDPAGTIRHARAALDRAGADDDHLSRGPAAGLLGVAYWTTGDLDAGHRWYTEAAAHLERAGHLSDVAGCAVALADIRLAQGRLGEAMRTLERALRLVTPEAGPPLRGAADVHVGIAGVLIERGELDAARRHLATSRDLGEHAGLPQTPYRWRVAMARIAEAEGDREGALALLGDAERRYAADYFPEVRPVAALRARLLARCGRWADALAWAGERAVGVDDEPDYLREFEHLILARALVARFTADGGEDSITGAVRLLTRLRQAAEVGGRTGTLIEVLVVQALAEQARGQVAAARATLRRALAAAEPQGHVRVFLDEGPPLVALLRAAPTQVGADGYARRLLAAHAPDQDGGRRPGTSVDPLSGRELDVLRLLGTDLDGPDIARELFLSVNTVRTHTKNIYAKLGVTNRRAAVRRGEELDLLARAGHRSGRGGDGR
ncbi:LuxR C-terminal-related transcriptional regulator [Geodermatophilus poikilotrophus]|uniref:LuxR C-terminal-related transcriptional regulator n=1 Tax=Geodermatophilus poikilotrophus TaxID=1333667 RepID=UPI001FE072EA|nr:LuxR C-terminal-related transcriptional regulator [Geodermatophilus poikilotrophus]